MNLDSDSGTATIVGTGPSDVAGFRAALLEAVADPAFGDCCRILVDARSLAYTPTMDESRQFVEFHLSNDTLRRSKVAVVVSKVVDYRMANMFSTLCDLGVLRSSASDRSLKLKIG